MEKIIDLLKDLLGDYLQGKYIALLIVTLLFGMSLGYFFSKTESKINSQFVQTEQINKEAVEKHKREFFRKAEGKY